MLLLISYAFCWDIFLYYREFEILSKGSKLMKVRKKNYEGGKNSEYIELENS